MFVTFSICRKKICHNILYIFMVALYQISHSNLLCCSLFEFKLSQWQYAIQHSWGVSCVHLDIWPMLQGLPIMKGWGDEYRSTEYYSSSFTCQTNVLHDRCFIFYSVQKLSNQMLHVCKIYLAYICIHTHAHAQFKMQFFSQFLVIMYLWFCLSFTYQKVVFLLEWKWLNV
jgi:hypothetical protein